MLRNIPNILTLLRILMIPVFIVVFYLPSPSAHVIAAIIFLIASVTDWLDGYLARNLNQVTPFGEFLDPIADKLVVITALVLLVAQRHVIYFTLPVLVIIGRELVITALREWMAQTGQRKSVAVSSIGKFKTAIQMVAILLFLVDFPKDYFFWNLIAYICLYVAVIATLWSMFNYLSSAWTHLTKQVESQ